MKNGSVEAQKVPPAHPTLYKLTKNPTLIEMKIKMIAKMVLSNRKLIQTHSLQSICVFTYFEQLCQLCLLAHRIFPNEIFLQEFRYWQSNHHKQIGKSPKKQSFLLEKKHYIV